MEMEMEVKKEMMMTALAATNVSDQKQDSVAGLLRRRRYRLRRILNTTTVLQPPLPPQIHLPLLMLLLKLWLLRLLSQICISRMQEQSADV